MVLLVFLDNSLFFNNFKLIIFKKLLTPFLSREKNDPKNLEELDILVPNILDPAKKETYPNCSKYVSTPLSLR